LFHAGLPPPALGWGLALAGSAIVTLASTATAALVVAIASRNFNRAGDVPWTERARLGWTARMAVGSCAVLLPVLFGLFGGFSAADPLGLPPRGLGILWAVAAWLGVLIVGRRLMRKLTGRDRATPESRRVVSLSLLIVAPQLLTWALIFALIPDRWNLRATGLMVAGAGVIGFGVGGGWLWVCRRLGLLHPASARLEAIVARTSERTGVRVRGAEELDSDTANALAFPVTGRLVFTGRLLEALDDEELAAVCAHELAHLDEPRGVVLARVGAAFLFLGLPALYPLTGTFGPVTILIAPLVVLLAIIAFTRIARRMEVRSDRLGHAHEGDVGTYALALEKLYIANLIPAVLKAKRPVHPHLYDRMIAAGFAPDYERPRPPKESLLAILPVAALAVGLVFLHEQIHRAPAFPQSATQARPADPAEPETAPAHSP